MAILSTNQRLIKVSVDYSAGNGINITSGVISVTGDNAPYSAGQNIYFDGDDNHVINGKDWGSEINDASANAYNVTTAWVQDNYANSADMTYISAMVDTKLDTSAWSSVSSNFATEDYVIMADNITYERAKGYVDSKDFATKEFVNENTSGKLNSTAFTNWQNGQYATDLQTIEGQISNKLDSSSFSDVSGTFYTNDNPSGFITGVDLSNYYTKDETSGKEELADAFANIPVGDPEVNAYVTSNSASIDESTDLVQSNSSTWNDVTAYQSNSANYLTAHQSLEGLMSASLLESADGKWTAYNSIPFKAGDEFPASADEAVQCVQSNSSNWQSVTNKLDSDVFTAWSANQESNNYQLSAGDGISIIDDDINKITRIDVTAQGGDMFTAYLEYNDQNQISGYAGSAFAGQGGGVTGEYVPLDTNGSNVSINLRKKEWQFSGGYSQGKISLGDGSNGAYISYSNTGGHPEYNWTIGGHIGGVGGYHYILNRLGVSGDGWNFGSAEYNRLVPTSTIADENKILSVNNQGKPEWVTGGDNPEVENYVQTNSGTIDDVNTSYQTNSGTFLTAHQAISAEEWNNCYDNVNTNSGAWGGSALPISAGPGVKLQLVNNTLIVSNDETVLWTNDNPSQVSANVTLTGTLSESCSSFKKLRFICKGSYDTGETFSGAVQAQEFYTNESDIENRVGVFLANRHGQTIYRDTCQLTFKDTGFTANNGSRLQGLTEISENTTRGPYILQVVGINRK